MEYQNATIGGGRISKMAICDENSGDRNVNSRDSGFGDMGFGFRRIFVKKCPRDLLIVQKDASRDSLQSALKIRRLTNFSMKL